MRASGPAARVGAGRRERTPRRASCRRGALRRQQLAERWEGGECRRLERTPGFSDSAVVHRRRRRGHRPAFGPRAFGVIGGAAGGIAAAGGGCGRAAPRELRVSFQDPSSNECGDARSPPSKKHGPSGVGAGGEVLKCTSNSSFRRNHSVLRTKTRSRLMDPPPVQSAAAAAASGETDRRSGKVPRSGQLRSGPLGGGKSSGCRGGRACVERRAGPFSSLP